MLKMRRLSGSITLMAILMATLGVNPAEGGHQATVFAGRLRSLYNATAIPSVPLKFQIARPSDGCWTSASTIPYGGRRYAAHLGHTMAATTVRAGDRFIVQAVVKVLGKSKIPVKVFPTSHVVTPNEAATGLVIWDLFVGN